MPFFACRVMDGRGDVMHLFDVVGNYLHQLDTPPFESFAEEPIIILILVDTEQNCNFIQEQIDKFKREYTAFEQRYELFSAISSVDTWEEKSRAMKQLLEKVKKSSKRYLSAYTFFEVSTPFFSKFPEFKQQYLPHVHVKGLGEHGGVEFHKSPSGDVRYVDNTSHRHMGFEESHYGIMLGPPIGPLPEGKEAEAKKKETKEKKQPTKASIGIKSEALKWAMALKPESKDKALIIPAYIKESRFLLVAMAGILTSTLAESYDRFIFVTNQPLNQWSIPAAISEVCDIALYTPANDTSFKKPISVTSKKDPSQRKKQVTIITTLDDDGRCFIIGDDDFHHLYRMARVALCSGDKTLETCIQLNVLPLYETPLPKRFFYDSFIRLLKKNGLNPNLLNILERCQNPIMQHLQHGFFGLVASNTRQSLSAGPFTVCFKGSVDKRGDKEERTLVSALQKLDESMLSEWERHCVNLREHHNYSTRLPYIFLTAMVSTQMARDPQNKEAIFNRYQQYFTPKDKAELKLSGQPTGNFAANFSIKNEFNAISRRKKAFTLALVLCLIFHASEYNQDDFKSIAAQLMIISLVYYALSGFSMELPKGVDNHFKHGSPVPINGTRSSVRFLEESSSPSTPLLPEAHTSEKESSQSFSK